MRRPVYPEGCESGTEVTPQVHRDIIALLLGLHPSAHHPFLEVLACSMASISARMAVR